MTTFMIKYGVRQQRNKGLIFCGRHLLQCKLQKTSELDDYKVFAKSKTLYKQKRFELINII